LSPILTVRDLSKTYERSSLFASRRFPVHALRKVSFSVARGEILGIVGESGSGKSTLARAIVGIDPPTSGSVVFDGMAVDAVDRRRARELRARMQIVSQDPNSALNPRLRIAKSVGEGLLNMGIPSSERSRRVREMLELVGISAARSDHYPHEFSGGMKQRICIARALSVNPDLLVLDEPVSSLDVSVQAQIVNLLMDLRSKLTLTYIFISHDINLVAYISDVIGVMKEGELVELARTDDLMASPAHEYTKQLLYSVPRYSDRRRYYHTLQPGGAV
jgi:ABC-type glutathione transport system ATPase component